MPSFESLFDRLQSPDLPQGLLAHIVSHIHAKEKKSALLRTAVFAIGLIASLIALVPAFQSVQASMAESGFLTYLSLLFSDTSAILSTGRSFGLILLESLPVFSLALLLAVLLILLESVFHLIADAARLFALQQKTL